MTPTNSRSERCRVCGGDATPFLETEGKLYWRCAVCEATFLDPTHWLPPEEEKQRYSLHENDPKDERYRAFLSRLAAPLLERLPPGLEGLDYGCGPGPALARMLTEAGHIMRVYDPFFFPDQTALERRYDFIVCTETAEHFHHPEQEFKRLDELLRPGGWLGLMTCFQDDDDAFAGWHYRRDETHVVFYREATFRRLTERFSWDCMVPRKDVVLMRKPEGAKEE